MCATSDRSCPRLAPRLGAALALPAMLALAGCPSGGAARAVRDEPPKLADAEPKNQPERCDPAGRYDTLAVDWDPEMRGDLEVAMKQGVAVVAYDCESLRLVDGCSIEGGYGYLGMTRKEKVIKMKDADEVKANLPLSGVKWLSDVGGSLERGRSLDVAIVMVGKQSTAHRTAGAKPAGDCDGATHYVRAATVGAFAMASTAAAEVKAAATLFGKGASGGSGSEMQVHNKDGSLEACGKATPDDKKAPAQCGAVLRLQLVPLPTGAGADDADDAIEVVSCPPGTVPADGACVKANDQPHQCRIGDEDGCAAQCDAGDAASCFILGEMYGRGIAVGTDNKRALALYRKGCEGGYLDACRGAAAKLAGGDKRAVADARGLLDQACKGGSAIACVELGELLVGQDEAADALILFRKACYGGEYEGCARIGALYAEGKAGLRKNDKLAVKFFEKGCVEGSMLACARLADHYKAGRGVRADKAKAAELAERACNHGYQPACAR